MTAAPRTARARHAVSRRAGRRQRWATSWRAALRLAYRDAGRHRGPTLLILVMVGLPVLLICAASAVLGTADVTAREALPVTLGHAPALLTDQGGRITQTADGDTLESGDTAAASSDHRPGSLWTTAQLDRLTGGTTALLGYPTLYAQQGGRVLRAPSLAAGFPALARSGLVRLVEGELPDRAGEVAVTPAGIAAGLPRHGPLTVGTSSTGQTVQVTAVVEASGDDFNPVQLVGGPEWLAEGTGTFLLLRDQPVAWSEVQAWNGYGLLVLSRSVVEHPPADAPQDRQGDAATVAVVVLLCLGLVLETTLLAGPAFAVSASRRRRSLALIASNGADQAQLTRYVLAQGVVLGGAGAVLGAVLGTVLGWVAVRVGAGLLDGRLTTIGHPPLGAYAWASVLITVTAAVAAVVAAAIPGRGAARLAIAGALAGRTRSRRLRAGGPSLGVALLLAGAAAVVWSRHSSGTGALYLAGFGGAVMAVGVLLGLSGLLALLGRRSAWGPAELRLAAREATRQRSRSVPAVAAVVVAAAVLTTIAISATSDDTAARRDYRPTTTAGHGVVDAGPDAELTVAEIRRQHPGWTVETSQSLGRSPDGGVGALVVVVPVGCPPASALAMVDQDPAERPPGCGAAEGFDRSIDVPAPSAFTPEVQLTDRQRSVLDGGGLLLTSEQLVDHGQVTLAVGRVPTDPDQDATLVRTLTLPAELLSREQYGVLDRTGYSDQQGAVLAAATVAARKLPSETRRWEVIDPQGPISRSDQAAVNHHTVTELYVERGYSSPVGMIIRVLFGVAGALVVVAALISTALARSEAQVELTTMAALGASPGFRRRLAAAQTVLVTLLGTGLGLLLGLAPGAALALQLTAPYADNPAPAVVAVPWTGLALVLGGVTVASALLAGLLARRSPVLTARPG